MHKNTEPMDCEFERIIAILVQTAAMHLPRQWRAHPQATTCAVHIPGNRDLFIIGSRLHLPPRARGSRLACAEKPGGRAAGRFQESSIYNHRFSAHLRTMTAQHDESSDFRQQKFR